MHTPTTRMWPIWLLASVSLLLAGLVHAAPTPDWPRFNHAAVQQHVLPRYATLARTTNQLDRAVAQFCEAPSPDRLQQARTAWQEAMQAWQGIQHVQFGPVQFLMRNFGLQFWPDRKNIGARQLRQALVSEQPYDSDFFRHASVSIQGFPALERLLFAESALFQLQQGRSCELGQAIAGHVADMSRDIEAEWRTLAAEDFSTAQDPELAADLAAELMAALVEPVEAIRDTKLLKAMGDNARAVMPKRLESHRSGHSLANIRANLSALSALYQGTDPSVDQLLRQAGAEPLADDIQQRFARLEQSLASIPAPLHVSLTQPDTYAALDGINAQLKQLSDTLHDAMDVLGIQLGFNSRDGD